MADRRKLIFDCDTGTDDAVALMSLLLSDNVDVIGVTSVHGNRPVENTTDNNLRLVEFLGMDVPVCKGCAARRRCLGLMLEYHKKFGAAELKSLKK